MTIQQVLATIAGGFLFPFFIRLAWGKLVDHFGPIGGWMAAGCIVGTTWAINHGTGLITQSGTVWIDMGLAAGVGLLVASAVRGGKVDKAVPNILAALVGGIIGGLLLSFYL